MDKRKADVRRNREIKEMQVTESQKKGDAGARKG